MDNFIDSDGGSSLNGANKKHIGGLDLGEDHGRNSLKNDLMMCEFNDDYNSGRG